jgi:hypothetical protein
VQALDPSLKPEEAVMPITRLPLLGLPSPIPLPNLQRLYFKFSPPIDSALLKKELDNKGAMQQLYNGVKTTVEQVQLPRQEPLGACLPACVCVCVCACVCVCVCRDDGMCMMYVCACITWLSVLHQGTLKPSKGVPLAGIS